MNKKGFTLIELLAVIVILAIIALIATPIVLNIINDAKESSELRSADFYLKALELSIAKHTIDEGGIADGEYQISSEGNLCLEGLDDKKCLNNKELIVEVKGKVPKTGTVTITNGQIGDIALKLENKVIVKNDKGELEYSESKKEESELNKLCKLENGQALTVGAKYTCDFGGGERNFYILELGSNPVENSTLKRDEVALILEGNYDTTTQTWCDLNGENPYSNSCNADGLTPKLDEISSVWTKVSRSQVVLPSPLQIIVANDSSKNTLQYTDGIQSWLYNWDNSVWGDGVYGYWTSSANFNYIDIVWYVNSEGTVHDFGNPSEGGCVIESYTPIDHHCGVRPVINLKI